MVVFVDTSALIAFLDADDRFHAAAVRTWQELTAREDDLVTSNYVLTEATAMCQRRLGMAVTRRLLEEVAPALSIYWVDEDVHDDAVSALLASERRDLSFVDCVCFQVMRRQGIRSAFTFDRHFRERGFECLP